MAPETLYAPTPDGWRLAIHHWPAKGPGRRFPVLMVHGLAANRLHLDLRERYSLARAAWQRGFSVYVLEMRGAGLTIAPGGRDRTLFQWGFRDYLQHDLPGALKTVLKHAQASAVHALGHSMGGLLLYGMAVSQPPCLRSIVTIASPLVCELQLQRREVRLLRAATRLAPANVEQRVPLRRLVGAARRFPTLSSRLVNGLLINTDNCEVDVLACMAGEAIDDIPLRLLVEFTQRMADARTGNGKPNISPFSYEDRLDRISIPVLAMSGSVDRLAPAAAVKALVMRLTTSDLRYREMGRRLGDRADYGHGDLLVGRNAPEEIYPLVLDFIEEQD